MSTEKVIVNERYLLEVLHLTPSFVARHSRAMGCFCRKPRRFFLTQVMAHLEMLAAEAKTKSNRQIMMQRARIRTVQQLADRVLKSKAAETNVADFAQYFEQRSV